MKQSVHGDDPVSQEILFFKKQREQADRIEQVFRSIKQSYSSSGIEEAKHKIANQFLSESGVYNKGKGQEFFASLKQKFANIILTSPSLQNHEIVGRLDDQVIKTQHELKLAPSHHQPQEIRAPQIPSLNISHEKVSSPHFGSPSPQKVQAKQDIPHSNSKQKEEEIMTIQPGTKSMAKLSPDRSEIQFTTTIDSLRIERLKTIDIGIPGGHPTALRVIDSRLVAIGYSDGALKIADLGDSCKFVRQYRFASAISAIDLHDEEDPMIPLLCGTRGGDSCVILLELQRKQPHVTRFKHNSEVTALVTLIPGQFVTGTSSGEVHLWNKYETENSQSLRAHSGSVTSLTTLSAGKTILSASADCTVKVFDVISGKLVPKTTLTEGGPVTLASGFHGNTKFAVFAVGPTLTVWNVTDKE